MATDEEREAALDWLADEMIWAHVEDVIENVSTMVYRRFRALVPQDDLRQVMHEWVLGAPKKIKRWHEENDSDGYHRVLSAVLYDEGSYYARRERDAANGGSHDDHFFYTKGMIANLLPSVYSEKAWVSGPERNGARNSTKVRDVKPLNEGNDWIATLADISRALSRIPREDQRTLFDRYALKTTLREQADRDDVPLSTLNYRVDAALKRLWRELGGPRWLTSAEDREPDEPGHWPAGRKAMSNAQARALTARESSFDKAVGAEW